MTLNRNKIILLILHGMLGFALFKYPSISTYYGLMIILFGTYCILHNADSKGKLPIIFALYITGIEVLLRMAGSNLFWEFGKYSVIYFLILGMIRKGNNISIQFPMLIYFILLLPSIIMLPLDSFNQWRQDIAFNLSGPACILISAIYLYNSKLNTNDMKEILLYAILPIFSMTILIIFRMPDFESYRFLPYSDPETSGGYGPNQVSTILGFGIAVFVYAQIIKKNLSGFKYIDILLLILFLGLGLLTFSRGGILAAIISSVLAISFYFFHDQKKIQFLSKSFILFIIAIISWMAIEGITHGVISQRYGLSGDSYGENLILDFTGRAEIYKIDLEIFSDHFYTGVGPGQANELRELYGYGKRASAHTEYSRMLAEHGILGLLSLLLLIGILIIYLSISSPLNGKFIKILFGFLALLTMGHSALRIAMPCLTFGFLFLNYED